MYSASSVAVDKGLGFDFSGIADLVKTALPVGLNIFQQQTQLKQIKAMNQSGYMQQPGVYGQAYGQLPMSQVMQSQPTFGGQYAQPSSGIGTGTILSIAAAAVVGLLAFKLMR
jgi:hypothetical protein